jgi:phosphatidylserine/phosphatidylglycerophosphate/cardiolipin synthase-like enzyme
MKKIRLIENSIMAEFVDLLVANRQRVYRLWIVSPWLSVGNNPADPFSVLAYTIHQHDFQATVITRPPREMWHHKCVQLLQETRKARLMTIDSLHSKLYVMECNGFRAAILGSVNFTMRGNDHNLELAIEISSTEEHGKSDESSILTRLISYAEELTSHPDVRLLERQ